MKTKLVILPFLMVMIVAFLVEGVTAIGDYAYDSFTVYGNPSGITQNGTHIFQTNYGSNTVYIFWINGTYTSSTWSTTSANTNAWGITTDNTWFWITDYADSRIYKYHMDGTYDSYFNVCVNPKGITNDGTYLYVVNGSSKIYKYFITNGSASGTITAGLALDSIYTDGTFLYGINAAQTEFYEFWMNGTQTKRHQYLSPSGNANPKDIDGNGTYFWIADSNDDLVYKYYQDTTFEPINITSCSPRPHYINSPGTYNLLNDVTVADAAKYGCIVFHSWGNSSILNGLNHRIYMGSTSRTQYAVTNYDAFGSYGWSYPIYNITIKNLQLRGNSKSYSEGIYFRYLNFSRIENITIQDYVIDYSFYTSSSQNNVFTQIFFEGNCDNLDNGLFQTSTTGAADGNTTISNSTMICSSGDASFISTSGYNLFIENNILNFTGTASRLFASTFLYNSTIKNNIVYRNEDSSLNIIDIGNSGANSIIYNNIFQANATGGGIYRGTSSEFNTTNSTGPNIIGGAYIGGNYYWNTLKSGYSQTCIDEDNDDFCDSSYTITTGVVDYLPLSSQGHVISLSPANNTNDLEYVLRNFTAIYQANPNYITDVNASFYYDGTFYTPTKTISGNNYTFNYELRVPEVLAAYNETRIWYFNFSVANSSQAEFDTYTVNRTHMVYKMIIDNTDPGPPDGVMRIRCIDEKTGAVVNCSLKTTFEVWHPTNYPNEYNRQYSFSNAQATLHTFYKYPNSSIANFTGDITFSASNETYPQRNGNWSNVSFNATTYNTIRNIYLLNQVDGMYSNYQVVTVGGQPIQGAHIEITTEISGSTVTIATADTDASGTASFFLDPNRLYTFTVSKEGYATQVFSIYPALSSYTITLGSEEWFFYYLSPSEGILWKAVPASGTLVCETGIFNFTYSVTSNKSNIYNCSMNFKYINGTSIANVSSNLTNASNSCSLWTQINVTELCVNSKWIMGQYYININGTWITLESDARWKLIPQPSRNWFGTLKQVFSDLTNLPEWGTQAATTDFSRIVFFFLFCAIFMAILNVFTGYDTAYPGAFIYILAIIIFLLSAYNGAAGPGYFYLEGATNPTFFGEDFSSVIDNWIFFVHVALLAGIYFFITQRRYQT